VYNGGWATVGGTSVAAPTLAADAALAEASPACAGHRIGFLNPILYRAPTTDFGDVTVGDNSSDGVTGFSAGPGYDMASGLGTPTAALGAALCTTPIAPAV
jgi:subtilase family serine protease